jgi:hypothetical protein
VEAGWDRGVYYMEIKTIKPKKSWQIPMYERILREQGYVYMAMEGYFPRDECHPSRKVEIYYANEVAIIDLTELYTSGWVHRLIYAKPIAKVSMIKEVCLDKKTKERVIDQIVIRIAFDTDWLEEIILDREKLKKHSFVKYF